MLAPRSRIAVILLPLLAAAAAAAAAATAAAAPPARPACERGCTWMLEHACGPLRADPDRCAGCALAVGLADHCTEADRRDACAPPPPPPPPPKGPKKVVVWMANPFGNASTVASYVSGLEPHRNAFTGLAYQYFAVCGAGSNDPDGSQDCAPADATGMPHLAKGHPAKGLADLGARLKEGLGTGHNGSALELWPVISYGNP